MKSRRLFRFLAGAEPAPGMVIRLIGFICLCALPSLPGHAAMVLKEWDAVTTRTDGSSCTDLAGYRLFTATNSLSALSPAEALADPAIAKTDISSAATSASIALAEDATYYFRLTAFNAYSDESDFSNEISTYLAITGAADTSSPTVPTGLAAANVAGIAFTLGWTASTDDAGVAGYLLDVSSDPSFSGFVSGYNNRNLGDVLSAFVSGLSPQTTYYARLRAYDAAANTSPDSAVSTTTTVDISSPTAPIILFAGDITASTFTLVWTASIDDVGVAGYRLDVSADSGFSGFVTGYNDLNVGNVTSRVISGLAVNTAYYARLRAYDAAANTSPSSAVSTTTTADVSPPAAPAGLLSSGISASAFTLGWTASTDDVGVAGYLLDVSSDPSFTDFVTGYSSRNLGNVLSALVSGLSPQTAYYARLRAYDAAANTSPDSAVSTTTTVDSSSPTVPAGLAAANVGNTAFTLGWTASTDDAGVTGYRLDVSADSGFSGFVTGYNDLNVGDVLSAFVSGLSPQTTYYSRLRAYDAAGNTSGNSATVSTRTLAAADAESPTAPGGVTVTGVNSSAFNLGWSAAADNVGVAGYLLDVSDKPSFPDFVNGYNNLNVGNLLSAFVSGLSPETAYYARLRAYDAAGNISGNSAPVSAATEPRERLSAPGVTAGPNILRPSRNPGSVITFRNLTPGDRVRIYTLTGDLVYDQKTDSVQAAWAGLNRSGKTVASGIYTVVIESGKNKKVLRVAVER